MPIVDAHVHLVGISPENGCFLSHRLTRRGFQRVQQGLLGLAGRRRSDFDRHARRRLRRWVEGSEVDYVGLLALDGAYDAQGRLDEKASTLYVSNDYLLRILPDSRKYLAVPSINPQRRDALDELERMAEAGAAAIKVLPNTQNFDPALPRYRPFWQRMAALGLPLLTHTAVEFTLPEHDRALGDPVRLRPALDEGLTVIAAHCGAGGPLGFADHLRDWLRMLEEYPNLYGDLSALVSPARAWAAPRVLRHPLARERVLLGSDYPVPVTPLLFAPTLGPRRAWRLQRIRNPLQRNLEALRALGLPPPAESRAAEVFRMPPPSEMERGSERVEE